MHLDYPKHFAPFQHPEHSVIGEPEHSVVGDFEHPDFEHYNFEHSDFEHSKNKAQPPPRERTLREMAAPDFTYEACAFNTLTRMSHMFLKLD